MPAQDTSEIKERILSFLRVNGPSLPVHISGEIKTSILFTSAFLSELVSEKKIKMSSMRIGSSPVYLIQGQEALLEKFSDHIKGKEKEAFTLIKEKGFLADSAQNPAIRVALRGIRDFAIPFKNGEEIIWRYFLIPENEFKMVSTKKPEVLVEAKKEPVKEIEKPLDIFMKPKEKKATRKRTQEKGKFFDKIKEFLAAKSIELKDVEGFTKNEIIIRVLDNSEEKIFIAYNKRKVSDSDIIKAHKKISGRGLPYVLLSLENPSKKTSELIKAMKDLSSISGMK